MKTKKLLQVCAAVFTIVTLLHLWRAVMGIPAQFGGWAVPVWPSWVAVVVAGYLAYSCWTAR